MPSPFCMGLCSSMCVGPRVGVAYIWGRMAVLVLYGWRGGGMFYIPVIWMRALAVPYPYGCLEVIFPVSDLGCLGLLIPMSILGCLGFIFSVPILGCLGFILPVYIFLGYHLLSCSSSFLYLFVMCAGLDRLPRCS